MAGILTRRRNILLNQPHIAIASGAIASFPDGADGLPVKQLTVAVNPVQDLHGYDNPWPAGGGKNLIHSSVAETIMIGTATRYGKVYDAGTYYITATENSIAWYRIYQNDITETSSLNVGTNVREAVVNSGYHLAVFAYSAADLDKVCVANQTITKFYPYSNICPISGWTGCEVALSQFNLFDPNSVTYKGYLNGKKWLSNANSSCVVVLCKPNTDYYIHVNGTAPEILRVGAIEGDLPLNPTSSWSDIPLEGSFATGSSGNAAYSTGSNAHWLIVQMSNTGFDGFKTNLCVNYSDPSKNGTFEPYQGQTLPITFPDSAGTVYGGTLTVNEDGTGKLRVNDVGVTITECGSVATASTGVQYANVVISDTAVTEAISNNFISSIYRFRTNAPSDTGWFRVLTNNIFIFDTRFTSKTVTNSILAVEQPQFVYKLATPIVYTLTAEQVGGILTTLKGENNVWADTGDIESVKYWTY